jgi:hypothetical protein
LELFSKREKFMLKKILNSLIILLACGTALADTTPAEQAKKNGFNTCQKTVEKIAKFLIGDTNNGAVSTWNQKNPDGRMFNSQVVLKYSDGHSMAVLNVAPVKNGKCDGSYTRVFVSETSCSVLRETTYKDWKFFGEIGGLVSLENKNASVSAVLLPNPPGCAAIQTEVVYE